MSPRRFCSIVFAALVSLLSVLPAQAQGTMVRLHTTQGPIDFKLLDAEAPLTVANFLAYVRGGDYASVMFHRSAKRDGNPFVIQGGGFRWPAGASSCCQSVTSRGRVQNEFSADRSNLRGTVAMAKLGGDPNSATSQWFVNMGDNAGSPPNGLDFQNGGFTVFARVTTPGMVVADRIAALPVVNAGGVFGELPLVNYPGTGAIQRSNLVLVTQATEFPPLSAQSESDRIFNYLEAAYPQYLSPSAGGAGVFDGYIYRYYGTSDAYVATKDGKVWYQVPALGGAVSELGSISDWLATAQAAGY